MAALTSLDASQDAYARAAFAWGTQKRRDQMREMVGKLDRAMVLDVMRTCAELTAELAERYNDLARAAGGLEPALVAAAVLAPDSSPDNVRVETFTDTMGRKVTEVITYGNSSTPVDVEGFSVNGVHTLPQRLADACAYCGKEDCAERFDHERADAGNEETWMRRARA